MHAGRFGGHFHHGYGGLLFTLYRRLLASTWPPISFNGCGEPGGLPDLLFPGWSDFQPIRDWTYDPNDGQERNDSNGILCESFELWISSRKTIMEVEQ